MKKLLLLLLFFILSGCQEGEPLDSRIWGSSDTNIDNRRYDMSIWMIKNNWFQGKTTKNIVEKLPEAKVGTVTTITNNKITYCVKEIRGWNIDSESRPLAYLDLYFKNDLVVKAVLRERKQSWSNKIDGMGGVFEQEYKTKLVWNAK
ncbi:MULTISPECIES: hypothetical protein [unclassified Gilliamella]|uniref:hypothetical protein n=1 Tax=unclassified Gilliamella TaxID=2685620 RepID=UPI0013059397|nr:MULTISPECIES: hypothetical protein [unclassified Gilliamella]MWP48223.1 hypothetical protein [Gilliamella sp. Lep-s35]MWP68143.1 hypothetical protein [Gilliamella sp. Lep-s5]MWP76363.1 hypothetical protein [Gilliamella sp. Lep-s21]